MTSLPPYIDPEAWADYSAMRQRIKKPMTPRIIRQKLAMLQKVKDAGHDVNAWIDAATNGHWLDFYEPRSVDISTPVNSAGEKTNAYLAEQSAHIAHSSRDVPARVAAIKEKLRRVA